jgi:hypothetical protein
MAKEPRACECGCGEMTKGGRFRPGHDSRMHGKKHTDAKLAERLAPSRPVSKGQLVFPLGRRAKDGTTAGMKVRGFARLSGHPTKHEALVYSVSPHGWIAVVQDDGHQSIYYEGDWEILETSLPKAQLGMTPEQRRMLDRLIAT